MIRIKNSCPKCGGDCSNENYQAGWVTCEICGKKWPQFALNHSKQDKQK